MSRSITQDMIAKYQAGQYTPLFLFEFYQGENLYKYTSLDVPFTVTSGTTTASGTYQSIGFNFESLVYSMGQIVDEANIRIDNTDSVMSAIFIDNDMREETARIYGGIINDDGSLLGLLLMFEGEIDEVKGNESELLLAIASPFARWDNRTEALHSASCRWRKFKGVECGYASIETHCDRSYARCLELYNTVNFGGFRWLPSIENETIWWGPTPSEYREEQMGK